jgi:hypothetical protein
MARSNKRTRFHSKTPKPVRCQRKNIEDSIEDHGTFLQTPPAKDYFFEDVHFANTNSALAQATHEQQLFMGEDNEHMAWARLRHFPLGADKESEVDLVMQVKASPDKD